MSPRALPAVALVVLAGCAGTTDTSNLAEYCTPANAYHLGSQARAYYGVCPKDAEAAFLAGLQRGRALIPPTPQAQPYITQMQETERQLLAADSDAERQRLRARLGELEWWAIHLITTPASYSVDG